VHFIGETGAEVGVLGVAPVVAGQHRDRGDVPSWCGGCEPAREPEGDARADERDRQHAGHAHDRRSLRCGPEPQQQDRCDEAREEQAEHDAIDVGREPEAPGDAEQDLHQGPAAGRVGQQRSPGDGTACTAVLALTVRHGEFLSCTLLA